MKQYNNEPYIISFTTFPLRYQYAAMMVFGLLKKQTYTNTHIVMTLYKDDFMQLDGDLKTLVDKGLLEVLIAEDNLRPHLKYFYAMQKYNNKPIITVDDDRIYSSNTIEGLVNKYKQLPFKSVVSIVAPKLKLDLSHKCLVPYDQWCCGSQRLVPNETSYLAMAEGFGSVLYPPNAFNMTTISVDELKTCLMHDDLYLKVLELRHAIPVTQVDGRLGYEFTSFNINGSQDSCLANHCNDAGMRYRERVTKSFEPALLQAFRLQNQ